MLTNSSKLISVIMPVSSSTPSWPPYSPIRFSMSSVPTSTPMSAKMAASSSESMVPPPSSSYLSKMRRARVATLTSSPVSKSFAVAKTLVDGLVSSGWKSLKTASTAMRRTLTSLRALTISVNCSKLTSPSPSEWTSTASSICCDVRGILRSAKICSSSSASMVPPPSASYLSKMRFIFAVSSCSSASTMRQNSSNSTSPDPSRSYSRTIASI